MSLNLVKHELMEDGIKSELSFPPKLKEIAKKIYEDFPKLCPIDESRAGFVYVYPHDRADGDAYGSAFALTLVFQKLGIKTIPIFSEPVNPNFKAASEEIPKRLVRYEGEKELAFRRAKREEVVAFYVDCSSPKRVLGRQFLLEPAKHFYAIDHHIAEEEVPDTYWIEPEAAATCEMLTLFFLYLEQLSRQKLIDARVANFLYAGFLTDSNRFSYDDVSESTFILASILRARGAEIRRLSSELFDLRSPAEARAISWLYRTMQSHFNGCFHYAFLSKAEMELLELKDRDLEVLPALLRDIEGVQIAVLVRESKLGTLRANVRSFSPVSARDLAASFGGGGHELAAGFSVTPVDREGFEVALFERVQKQLELAGYSCSEVEEEA
ncbi:MAG: DHH family phosphoesterase [Eubacteriales bacterium]|nr:DHH family phosphoesterase [Eubacteriales bacterium]